MLSERPVFKRWIPVFLDSKLELIYLQKHIVENRNRCLLAIFCYTFMTLIFIPSDYSFFANSPQFYQLLIARMCFFIFSVVVVAVVLRVRSVIKMHRWVLSWWLATALIIFYVNSTRPGGYVEHAMIDVLILFGMYAISSNPFKQCFMFAMFFTVLNAFLFFVDSANIASIKVWLIVSSYFFANIVGGAICWRFQALQRRQYFTQQQELKYRKELYLSQTEQLQSELLQAANRNNELKDALLCNMSHELLTPLNGIQGGVELLKEMPLEQEAKKVIAIIDESRYLLQYLTSSLLKYVEYSSDDNEIEKRCFSTRDHLIDIHRLYQSRFEQRGIDFSVNSQDSFPEYIKTDRQALDIVVCCLLDNALKFTNEGHVAVKVKADVVEKSQIAHISYEISDTGVGIAPQNLDNIFDFFNQADKGLKRRYAGLGLGLSICNKVISRLGGRILCESKLGAGSTFTFSISVDISGDHNLPLASLDEKIVIHGRPKVLVVEDVEFNRLLFSKMLKKIGCDVITANNGLHALHRIDHDFFNLVFMDIQMPEMDGLTATKIIRDGHSSNANTPIIALTANVMPRDKKRYLNGRMNAVMCKPASMLALKACVAQWYRGSEADHSTGL